MTGTDNRNFQIERHPRSGNRSLRAVSAADEHILGYLREIGTVPQQPLILHDRFGGLTIPLTRTNPTCPIFLKSQEKSIRANLASNGLALDSVNLADPLEPYQNSSLVLMRIPKSLELLRFSLSKTATVIEAGGSVIAGFMTRYFTPGILEVAGEYFREVKQSRAWKKSRLLLLGDPVRTQETDPVSEVQGVAGELYRQYPGVFSSGGVDIATAFLLENLEINSGERRVLDLGCGNGVIADRLLRENPTLELLLMDDFRLAVESARMNLGDRAAGYFWSDSPLELGKGSLDLVVTNPPFHFEHEIDISVPDRLFGEARQILKPGGRLLLVGNRHLNYRTRLQKVFDGVSVIARNDRFEVLQAIA